MIKNWQHQDMKGEQVAIIATPLMGNLVPVVEFATHLINHHSNRISVTILAFSVPHLPLVDDYIESQTSNEHIRFIQIHPQDSQPPNQCKSMTEFISLYIQSHKPIIKKTLQNLTTNVPLVVSAKTGNDVDLIPSIFLSNNLTTLPKSDSDSATQLMVVKSFTKPVPLNAYPLYCINKEELGYSWFLHHTLRSATSLPGGTNS
nr:UDP-glycosyltransferase 43-like [Tanacetum cinerariifolium]